MDHSCHYKLDMLLHDCQPAYTVSCDALTANKQSRHRTLSKKGLRMCRGLVRSREEDIMGEIEDLPHRGSQSRQVRQRQNPEKVSELTSIRELLQEVAQDTHDGRHQNKGYEVSPALSAILAYGWKTCVCW